VAVARLGVPIVMIGRVGDDDPGRQLRDDLTTEGVDCTHLKIVPGSSLDLTAEDVSSAEDVLCRAAVCLLHTETSATAVERAVELCRENGVETIAAAEGAYTGTMPPSFSEVDTLCCDEIAAAQFTGLSTAKSPRAVAAALAKRGCRSVVLRLGERGAYVFSPDGESAVPGFALRPVNAVAAADAFIAALAAGRAWGWSLHEAIRFANAAGALAGSRAELHSALPARTEIEALLISQL
jgi:ribokinase